MNPRKSKILLIVMVAYALYTLVPLVWLLFSSTKTQSGLFSSFGLWFSDDFAFFDNLVATFSY
ncbi:carbohydrate ABC transporter permease, partial [Microbacterium sp. ISL-103]|nr:carbohydrate ABC transporter permease [Microbacterium sp. ISL-103]